MTVPVILYRYDGSPYAHKIDNALILKKIPHQRVNVSPVLPRPQVADILGIPYRRIPLLAIGNDVYCDTNLIVSALERRFPQSQGFASLFPARNGSANADTGMIKAFSKFWVDAALFPLATSLMPWEKLPPAVVKDRGEFMGKGGPLNVTALVATREGSLAQLAVHLALVEEQLRDGRVWLFDTVTPSIADISVHFVLQWGKGFRTSRALFDGQRFPLTEKWIASVTTYLKDNQVDSVKISGEHAGNAILSSDYEPYSDIGFDAIEAGRLGLKLNDIVSVTPSDTGRTHPTTGKLVAFGNEEVVLEISAPRGVLRCHFPRLGYVITTPKAMAKL